MSNLHNMPIGAALPGQGQAPIFSDKIDAPHRCLKIRAAVSYCGDINSCPAGSKCWSARQAKCAKA